MTNTPQLIRRKAEIEALMRGLAREKLQRSPLYLDLDLQLHKIEYALARRHVRHNPEQWEKDDDAT
jgi:hypothetical protein